MIRRILERATSLSRFSVQVSTQALSLSLCLGPFFLLARSGFVFVHLQGSLFRMKLTRYNCILCESLSVLRTAPHSLDSFLSAPSLNILHFQLFSATSLLPIKHLAGLVLVKRHITVAVRSPIGGAIAWPLPVSSSLSTLGIPIYNRNDCDAQKCAQSYISCYVVAFCPSLYHSTLGTPHIVGQLHVLNTSDGTG